MKKRIIRLLLHIFTGALMLHLAPDLKAQKAKNTPAQDTSVCYSCFWEEADLPADLLQNYQQYKTSDSFVSADIRYVIWRATGNRNCDALQGYRQVAEKDPDPTRRFMAEASLAFASPECEQDASQHFKQAAELGDQLGRGSEARMLRALSSGNFQPRFEPVRIEASLDIPPHPKTLILGESTIELAPGAKVGAQVERVARDWLESTLNWNITAEPLVADSIMTYHEGAVVRRIMNVVPTTVYPLAGTLVALHDGKWFGPDETGVFRFQVLDDKIQYPTTHAARGFGWIEDTHGISALVSQAIERNVNLVIGCGDFVGKAQAAFYLSQRGINVLFPGDRFQHLLIGYKGKGVLLGTAPVKKIGGKAVIGHQPVRFSLQETIVVEDTPAPYPIQYYDAAAKYFRRLSTFVPLKIEYVNVYDVDEIDKVLERADELDASVVAVRITRENEDAALRAWLGKLPTRRAVLFHSGLYPYAQALFEDFPVQVTFGDLRPRFE